MVRFQQFSQILLKFPVIILFYGLKKILLKQFLLSNNCPINSYFMALQDFQGQGKYKYLVPSIYVLSWILMVIGPLQFPIFYNQFCMFIAMYLAFRGFVLCGQNAQLVINTRNVLKNTKNASPQDSFAALHHSSVARIYHAFIIPNYNQQIQLLVQTLQVLSRHKKALSTYMVFLAMQKHQVNSSKKAEFLTKKFQDKFLYVGYSIHEIRLGEYKGKASNVNWCAQNAANIFEKLMIPEDNVLITVIDADSWVPQIYIDEVEKHLFEQFQQRHITIFQPPQIYTRNNLDVSIIIRTYDDMYSSMHASSLISMSGITFSLSNYTLSYNLIRRVGFWDTVEEAIGEDMHMCLKSVFKSHGEVRTVPIYTPFNQLNIQTGNGYISDVKSKFWQVERHTRGVADIGYCLNMMSKQQWTWKTLWMTLSIIEVFILPIVIPWPLVSISGQYLLQKLDIFHPEGVFTLQDILFVMNLVNVGTFLSNLIYEVFKRHSSKLIYGIQNSSLIRMFEGSILYTFNLMFLTIPTFVVGAFGNLFSNRQYVVTQKNSPRLSYQSTQKL